MNAPVLYFPKWLGTDLPLTKILSFLIVNSEMLKYLASLKISVLGLLWLFVLTLWGTIAQVQVGLYEAQERFFYSFVLWVFGYIPLPGGRFILWLLFVNLMAATLTRFIKYRKKRYAGLIIVHLGLLFYLVAAFVVFHGSVESTVHLAEDQETAFSTSYHQWEIVLLNPGTMTGHLIDVDQLLNEETVSVEALGVTLAVKEYAENARMPGSGEAAVLQKLPVLGERSQNIPAVHLVASDQASSFDFILFGQALNPSPLPLEGAPATIQLRRKQCRLPFTIRLDDFRVQFYPGTDMAKSYESDVTINDGALERKALISMNQPLRYGPYTAFQSSYQIDQMGREYSIFAVVRNGGRYLPYVSSLLVFGGLALHFLAMALIKKEGNHAS